MSRSKWLRIAAVLLILGFAFAACGGGETEESQAGAEIIRFAFAPDPVWDYLKDTGEIAKWEEANNLRIVTSETWDEFTFFAGGHGELVSMGTHELPVLEQETGMKVVAFGRYNHQKVPLWRRAGDPYNTIGDVPDGSTICATSAVGNTIIWSLIAAVQEGKDYRVGSGDYNLVVGDHDTNGEFVERGECVIGAANIEATLTLARTGVLEMMYDGRVPWQIWRDDPNLGNGHVGIESNLMVATKEWYDAHQAEAKAFLQLWQTGVDLWRANKDEIIDIYPQHFPAESPEDAQYMKDYFTNPANDFFDESVYLDQAWIDAEVKIYDLMKQYNWMDPNAANPEFVVITP